MATTDIKEEVSVPEKKSVEEDEVERSTATEGLDKEEEYDIVNALEQANHITKTYPNGLTIGVRFNPISGAKTVHADMVYVFDWRKAMFPRNSMALKAAILEVFERKTQDVFRDFGLEHRLDVIERRTTKGSVELRVLGQEKGGRSSFLQETRTIYVVTKDTAPIVDFSWLTDPGRIVGAENFLVARKSDIRSVVPEIEKRIEGRKWDLLQSGIEFSWAGILSAIFALISATTVFYSYMTQASSIVFPMIAAIAGFSASLASIILGRRRVTEFNMMLSRESEDIMRVGDDYRIETTKRNNQEILDTLRTMRFVVSPLMGRVVGSLNIRDFEGACFAAEKVLDELVRLSPFEEMEKRTDPGLNKFLTLFQYLDPDYDEATLSMTYVAFTDSNSAIIESGRIIDHTSILLESLYRSGIIPPESKLEMDDMLSERGLKEFKAKLDIDLAHEKETVVEEEKNATSESPDDDISDLDSTFFSLMKEDGVEPESSSDRESTDSNVDKIPVISAETAEGSDINSGSEDQPENEGVVAIDKTATQVIERIRKKGTDSDGGRKPES